MTRWWMSFAELERFRRALERIRDHRIDGPVDEWAEAGAYHDVVTIAGDALDRALGPGVVEVKVLEVIGWSPADGGVLRVGERFQVNAYSLKPDAP